MIEAIDLKQEFRDLLQASCWSQAEAARQLGMTPSALSQIVRPNSTVKPSPVTLRLFKLLLLTQKPETLTPMHDRRVELTEKWEIDLILALRALPPATRELGLKVLGTFVEGHLPKGSAISRTRRSLGRGRCRG